MLRSGVDETPHPPAEESPAPSWSLTPEEVRVLGCLLEKAATTPEQYPLTMNSLVAACCQKTNRDPVVDYNEALVEEAIAGLRSNGLALLVSVAGSRVAKFQHALHRVYPDLNDPGTALLTVLLLRGRQTLGELRTRTERIFAFDSLDDVQAALDELVCFPPRQLVQELPSGDGHRVPTFIHLLGDPSAQPTTPHLPSDQTPATNWRHDMEQTIAELRTEVASLRKELDEFRNQFG